MSDRFTLTWRNAEVVILFLPKKVAVTLYADNVCVDQKEIPYDEIKVERDHQSGPSFPTEMELGKTYHFIYGLQANLVIKPVEEEKNEDAEEN